VKTRRNPLSISNKAVLGRQSCYFSVELTPIAAYMTQKYTNPMNHFRKALLVSSALLIGCSTIFGQDDAAKLIAPGATVQQISKQFKFTEGPAVDKKGNIFFTDQPNDKIWKYDTEGNLSLYMEKTGRSNGLYFDKKGNLIACADEKDEMWSISPKGTVTGFV
jgi:hypothetical protein